MGLGSCGYLGPVHQTNLMRSALAAILVGALILLLLQALVF